MVIAPSPRLNGRYSGARGGSGGAARSGSTTGGCLIAARSALGTVRSQRQLAASGRVPGRSLWIRWDRRTAAWERRSWYGCPRRRERVRSPRTGRWPLCCGWLPAPTWTSLSGRSGRDWAREQPAGAGVIYAGWPWRADRGSRTWRRLERLLHCQWRTGQREAGHGGRARGHDGDGRRAGLLRADEPGGGTEGASAVWRVANGSKSRRVSVRRYTRCCCPRFSIHMSGWSFRSG